MDELDAVAGGELSEERRRKVEEYLEEEERRFNQYKDWLAGFLTAVAFASPLDEVGREGVALFAGAFVSQLLRRAPAPKPA